MPLVGSERDEGRDGSTPFYTSLALNIEAWHMVDSQQILVEKKLINGSSVASKK